MKGGDIPLCRESGFRHVGASVMARNKEVISFYESLGFRVCGHHSNLIDWDGELLDAVEIEVWIG